MNTASAVIDDLSGDFPETTIGTKWQLLSDAVMGGVSAGRMIRADVSGRPAVRLQGSVSLENSGGFLQMAVDLAPDGGAVDGTGFAGIALEVLGNGETYGLHIRTTELSRPWQSYRQGFRAEPAWQEIALPFSGFLPYRTEVPLDIRQLRRLGVVAIGRAFEADIAIGRLRFY